jgi:bifunctional UDP-N-acetylglucosamine pyrophosphorylase / glucosamine-1-phosphate N-acetyltransferase
MSEYRPISGVVLAAGEGTRMKSATPKVLHPLCGRPMLLHVIDALAALPLERIVVVVGHGAEMVTKTLQDELATELPVELVEQSVQRGTGDAASVALTASGFDLDADDDLFIVPGDAPLVRSETLAALARHHRETDAAATLLSADLSDDCVNFGRVVRDDSDRVTRIVERADASEEELEIDEVSTSIYCIRRGLLAPALRRLSPENAGGEYYLTDVVEVLRDAGHTVETLPTDDPATALHVNDRAQLARAEGVLRSRLNERWMRAGVTMTDPDRTYIDAGVEIEPDVTLLPGTMLTGRSVVGGGSVIGPQSHLVDTIVGERCVIRETVATEAEIGDDVSVGPFAHLRPGSRLGDRVRVGNFVEIKNAELGEGAKANHLAYLGDAEVGPGANVGAGTITANYDGVDKHRTVIGAGARIGSNSVLVAPVEVGDHATTAAGAVVVRDVPPRALAKGVPAEIEEDWAPGPRTPTREDEGEREGS